MGKRRAVATADIADISPEYLTMARQAMRISSEDFDGELRDLIHAARRDLALGGIRPERAADESDPLVKRAVATYIKAEFGLDNEAADKYRAAYAQLKVALALSADYVSPGEV